MCPTFGEHIGSQPITTYTTAAPAQPGMNFKGKH